MKNIQLRHINKLAQQLISADDDNKRAAVCLAHLIKPGNSVVAEEALAILLETLNKSKPSASRKWAAWALATLAGYVSPEILSNQIVPQLIRVLKESHLEGENLAVARQAYQSLTYIGTPDAVMAVEHWQTQMKDLQSQTG